MRLVQRARAERCKPERGRKDTRTHIHTQQKRRERERGREGEREREEEDQLDKRYDFKAVSEEEL